MGFFSGLKKLVSKGLKIPSKIAKVVHKDFEKAGHVIHTIAHDVGQVEKVAVKGIKIVGKEAAFQLKKRYIGKDGHLNLNAVINDAKKLGMAYVTEGASLGLDKYTNKINNVPGTAGKGGPSNRGSGSSNNKDYNNNKDTNNINVNVNGTKPYKKRKKRYYRKRKRKS